jgi:hypothetical protein
VTGKTKEQPQPQGRQLSAQDIQIGAQALVKWIAEGRIDVPSDAAMNGTLGVINSFASGLATGSVVCVNPQVIKELQEKAEGKKPARKKTTRKKVSRKKKS